MKTFNELSNKQKKFITEYVKDFNGTRAAIEAGYSEAGAHVRSSELLKDPDIKRIMDDLFSEFVMSAQETLFHLSTIARGDIALLTDNAGNPDIKTAKGNHSSNLIKSIKQKTVLGDDSEIHETEIEAYDRLKALDLLAKYHQLTTTSRVKVDDWRSQAIEDIKSGTLPYNVLAEAFDESLAAELFRSAGVPIPTE